MFRGSLVLLFPVLRWLGGLFGFELFAALSFGVLAAVFALPLAVPLLGLVLVPFPLFDAFWLVTGLDGVVEGTLSNPGGESALSKPGGGPQSSMLCFC